MGSIIYWTIIRTAITIPTLWLFFEFTEYKYWLMFSLMALYGIIVQPAYIHYRIFLEENKDILDNTLCSSCKHFDKTAVLCLKHDEHPSLDNLPCEGVDWSPVLIEYEKEKY